MPFANTMTSTERENKHMNKHINEIRVKEMKEVLKKIPNNCFLARSIMNELNHQKKKAIPVINNIGNGK